MLSVFTLNSGARAEEQITSFAENTIDGFWASAVLTPTGDWEEQWNTPYENGPKIVLLDEMPIGDSATLLVFIIGPEIRDGQTRVFCDAKMFGPNGESIGEYPAALCHSQANTNAPGSVYLTGMIIDLYADSIDDIGTYTFEVGVTDTYRDVRIPLKVRITMIEAAP